LLQQSRVTAEMAREGLKAVRVKEEVAGVRVAHSTYVPKKTDRVNEVTRGRKREEEKERSGDERREEGGGKR